MTSNPGTPIKYEFAQSQESMSAGSSGNTQDAPTQRLGLVEKKPAELIKQLGHKKIYIDAMRSFLSKVKYNSSQLTIEEELELLLLTVSCIDLTTLSGDDTITNVERLCYRAIRPLDEDKMLDYKKIKCAAVCVYPARIVDCKNAFGEMSIDIVNIAAVAAGFPSGQYGLKTRIAEIVQAVESGADEIDVVINRPAAIAGTWPVVFEELCEMRRACDVRKAEGHEVHLKVIIGAGDLLVSNSSTIYTASMIAILSGADFVKTSTGKESVNATLPIGYIMMRAIADYHNLTGYKVGFKPAGGIRTYRDALDWLMLVKMLLGPEWLNNRLFRFGASGLLDDVERRIQYLCKLKASGPPK